MTSVPSLLYHSLKPLILLRPFLLLHSPVSQLPYHPGHRKLLCLKVLDIDLSCFRATALLLPAENTWIVTRQTNDSTEGMTCSNYNSRQQTQRKVLSSHSHY